VIVHSSDANFSLRFEPCHLHQIHFVEHSEDCPNKALPRLNNSTFVQNLFVLNENERLQPHGIVWLRAAPLRLMLLAFNILRSREVRKFYAHHFARAVWYKVEYATGGAGNA
jgi:hypothetical protein